MKEILALSVLCTSVAFVLPSYGQTRKQEYGAQIEINAAPDIIWKKEIDVTNWPKWDTGLDKANLEGSFQQGAKGIMVDREGRNIKFKIVEVEPNNKIIIEIQLPGGKMYLDRRLVVQTNGKVMLSHSVYFTGWIGGMIGKSLKKKYQNMVPQTVLLFKNQAESR